MDAQHIIIDQFTIDMTSIQEALTGLSQRTDIQQGRRHLDQDEISYDSMPLIPVTQLVNDIIGDNNALLMSLVDTNLKLILSDEISCEDRQYFH